MNKPPVKVPSKPGAVVIGGERWPVMLLRVLTKDDDGSPRTFQLIRNDEETSTRGRPEFFTVYAPPSMQPSRKS